MKRLVSSILFVLIALASLAQTYTNTKQIRFYPITNASDTAATVANSGRGWYDFVSHKFRCNINGTNTNWAGTGGGGGGTIGGSIASTQVAFGTAANTIGGDANFTFNSITDVLTVNTNEFVKLDGGGATPKDGIAIGLNAGYTGTFTTSQGANTGLGRNVLTSLVDGSIVYESSYNTAIGDNVLNAITNQYYNTGVGYNVFSSASYTATSNTAIGALCGTNVSTGSGNTFGGYNTAGAGIVTGSENAFWGRTIAANLTSGSRNTAMGNGPLSQLTTGSGNSIIGSEGFETLTTQSYNTGLGYWTGVYAKGTGNTAVGAFSFGQTTSLTTSLTNSTALGYGAGEGGGNGDPVINGSHVMFLGYSSGYEYGVGTSSLTNAVGIGNEARVSSSNSMVFGGDSTFRVNYSFGYGESYGSGLGVVYTRNADTNPTSAPSNGYLTYANSGVGYIRNAGEPAYPIGRNVFTTTGDLVYATGTSETRLAAGTLGYVLTSGGPGVAPSWAANPAGFANPMTTEGDLILGGVGGTPGRLGIGANTYVLTSNGTTASWQPGGSGFWATTGTSTIAGNTVIDFGATGGTPYTNEFRADNLTTTTTVGRGLVLNNNTAATGGATVQYSPSFTQRGRAWTGAASQTVDFIQYVLPAAAATPTGKWILARSINGGALTNAIAVDSDVVNIGITFNNGGFQMSGTTNGVLAGNGNTTIRAAASSTLQLQHNNTSVIPSSTFGISLKNLAAAMTFTSGTGHEVAMLSGFAPTSGTGIYNGVTVNPTINQTGGANGDITILNVAPVYTSADAPKGFYYNPTVTSVTGTHHVVHATQGALALDGKVSPSQITSDQNDYNPTAFNQNYTIRINSDANRTITGMVPGVNGDIKQIVNTGTFDIILKDESSASTAANRFALNNDITLGPDNMCIVWYDGTSSRWRAATPGSIQKLTVTVAGGATLQNINATPVNVISAPGANLYLNIHNVTASYNYGATAYTFVDPIYCAFTGTAFGWKLGALANINGTADFNVIAEEDTSIDTGIIVPVNTGFFLTAGADSSTAGDGDLQITVYFTVEPINP